MTFDHDSLRLVAEALKTLEVGFAELPPVGSGRSRSRVAGDEELTERMAAVLQEAAGRLHDNFPYHHPLYVGQMLKPPHPVARLAYSLALYLNPNNHALDGGRASSLMEKEAVAQLAAMFGWTTHLGHLTSGGTFANLEALWVSRELRPGKAVAASSQAHYTHSRVSAVLGMSFRKISVDALGRMDLADLEAALRTGQVGTVVATLGTTAAGTVDPLPGILALRQKYDFRVHIDAAYGGYYVLAGNLGPETRQAYDAMGQADSIVIDPHKHGLQPYGCGCVLFRDPAVGRFYQHNSPYTYFTSEELHLGEISLECSRPGASAVALWATQRLLPLERGGEFARSLEACREAALALHGYLKRSNEFVPLLDPELDIVVWAVRAETSSEASTRAQRFFDSAAKQDVHLALAKFPRQMAERSGTVERWDTEDLTCLRVCVMKAEHGEWLSEITRRLERAGRSHAKA
jgi:tyrosine decarboxylase / aspartate 1-decarboxylase